MKIVHYKIETKGYATFFDIKSGDLSWFIDPIENHWIAFKKEPRDMLPASAASGFRGILILMYCKNQKVN